MVVMISKGTRVLLGKEKRCSIVAEVSIERIAKMVYIWMILNQMKKNPIRESIYANTDVFNTFHYNIA